MGVANDHSVIELVPPKTGMLEHMLQYFLEQAPVYGVDICGECSTAIALPEYFQAEGVNGKTNVELFRFLRSYCCS